MESQHPSSPRDMVLDILKAGTRRLAAMNRLRNREQQAYMVVFAYHGVTDRVSVAQVGFGLQLLTSDFERHCRVIAANFRSCHVDDLDGNAHSDSSRPYALLTFDDVYENVVTLALPIMEAYRLKWELFVSSDYVGTPLFWWDKVRLALLSAPEAGLRLREKEYDLSTANARQKSAFALESRLAVLPAADRNHLVDDLYACYQPFVEMTFGKILEDLRPISNSSLHRLKQHPLGRIGLHTASHPALPSQCQSDLEAELAQSQAWYTQRLGSRARDFCHPFGMTDARVDEACQQYGFQTGFLLDPHLPARLTEDGRGNDLYCNVNRLALQPSDDHRAIIAKARGDYDWLIKHIGMDRI